MMLWRARSAARRQRIVLEQMPIALIALSRARQTRQRRLVSLTALPFFISRLSLSPRVESKSVYCRGWSHNPSHAKVAGRTHKILGRASPPQARRGRPGAAWAVLGISWATWPRPALRLVMGR